jgi:hypothetical protein
MHAKWFEEGNLSDLLRYFNEIVGRIGEDVHMKEGSALLDNVTVEPEYIACLGDGAGRKIFVEHLGEAGLANDDGGPHLGVLTHEGSWSEAGDSLEINAEIHMREGPGGEWYEPGYSSASLHAFLPRSHEVDELLAECCKYPCALMECVEFGVIAYWTAVLGGDKDVLDFELGPKFNESIAGLNYKRNTRYAKSCLRVMALIAGGRASEVEGHEERSGAGAENPVVCDVAGNPVIRSRLANNTPDAHRIFWIRGKKPIFLNVSGHEGHPTL